MNDNPNSRPGFAADFARLVRHLYLQGWSFVADRERLAELAAVADEASFEAALDALLEQLQGQIDAVFQQLEEQARSLCIPHETMLTALSQLGALQDTIQGPLDQAERDWIAALPSLLPRLGLFQQRQNRLQASAEALAELRAAQNGYLALTRNAANEAIAGFQQLMQQRRAPIGFKELYPLWLDAGEAAYERMLASEAYSIALARVTNASATVTAQAQDSLDEVLGYFKLPTRREMIATQQRLHELRRRQRATERAMPAELEALRREMAELRAELKQLRQPMPAPASSQEAPPKEAGGNDKRRHVY